VYDETLLRLADQDGRETLFCRTAFRQLLYLGWGIYTYEIRGRPRTLLGAWPAFAVLVSIAESLDDANGTKELVCRLGLTGVIERVTNVNLLIFGLGAR